MSFKNRKFFIQSGYIYVIKTEQLIFYEGWKQRRNIIKSFPDQPYVDYYRGCSIYDLLFPLVYFLIGIHAYFYFCY